MLSWPGRLAVTLFAACLLAGCQPAAPPPTPVPTYACTPEAGGAEFSCSQQQYDEMVAKDKLYAEAVAVYRRFLQEDLRISRTGGTDSATSVLLETTAEAFLKKALEGYRQDRAEGLSARGGDRVVRSIERLAGVSKGGSLVALRACVDASSVSVYKAGKYVGKGLVTRDDLYFKRIGSALKVIGADGSEVSSCG